MDARAAARSVHRSAREALWAESQHLRPRSLTPDEVWARSRTPADVQPYKGGDAILGVMKEEGCGGGCGSAVAATGRVWDSERRTPTARRGSRARRRSGSVTSHPWEREEDGGSEGLEKEDPFPGASFEGYSPVPGDAEGACQCYRTTYNRGDPCPVSTVYGATIKQVFWSYEDGRCVPHFQCEDPAARCSCYWVQDGGESDAGPAPGQTSIVFGYVDAWHSCLASGHTHYDSFAGSVRLSWSEEYSSCDILVSCTTNNEPSGTGSARAANKIGFLPACSESVLTEVTTLDSEPPCARDLAACTPSSINGTVNNLSARQVMAWTCERGRFFVPANSSTPAFVDVDHVRDHTGQWWKLGPFDAEIPADLTAEAQWSFVAGTRGGCRVSRPGVDCGE